MGRFRMLGFLPVSSLKPSRLFFYCFGHGLMRSCPGSVGNCSQRASRDGAAVSRDVGVGVSKVKNPGFSWRKSFRGGGSKLFVAETSSWLWAQARPQLGLWGGEIGGGASTMEAGRSIQRLAHLVWRRTTWIGPRLPRNSWRRGFDALAPEEDAGGDGRGCEWIPFRVAWRWQSR
jgi:hypothetical protein